MSDSIKLLRVKRRQQEAANRLLEVIESELDAALAGVDRSETFVALCNAFVGQLAAALCATIDAANDQTSGVATAALLRDFLRHVAHQLAEYVADHRENGSHVAAGSCAVVAAELRESADRLDEFAQSAVMLLRVVGEKP